MTSHICLILTNDGPPLVELVKELQVQNILNLYNTNQDYIKLNNRLVWNYRHLLYSTISTVDSTGNVPKSTSIQPVHYIFADDVFINLEQISAKEAMDIY